MFSKFLNLSKEKQERILNAAMKEFAQKGFENASTNEIVKEADISKGILFHYFKNKKQLFLFLYDYCVELNINEFYGKINLDERDLFVRLRQILSIKFELMNRHPEMFKFLEVAYMEDSLNVKNELESTNIKFTKSARNKIFEGIDISKFKDDIDVKKAINIIIWSLQKFSEQVMERAKLTSKEIDYDKAFAEADEYIEIFKNNFYK
ncbi:TetR/AcrR family transcriptional regulator [Clostridium sp. MSJ-11]|uniref:TetR/AcrR family transcriptional regulator n=1 Tax=Clostridium mobile TaxID=2841512 RepID=A0ABS6EDV6_9CLOT|nr:TetR/AcrR family transcriptional regulator [Clostridium mobile]MBU5483223.1 TetR/AcrR family transcriptional regulator [Clostridium mobile]